MEINDRLKVSIESQLEELDMEFGDIEDNLKKGIGYGLFSFKDVVGHAKGFRKKFVKLFYNSACSKLKKEYKKRLDEMTDILQNALDDLLEKKGDKNEI